MRHLLLSVLFALPALAKDITIRTLTAQMKYDTTELQIAPGETLNLTLENEDDLPHNLVICKPGTDVIAMSNKQMENATAAVQRNWLPDDPAILVHTKMLNPHEKETIRFTPKKPGFYPFVCTFPGHALIMNGKIRVQPQGTIFENLSFKLYLGEWGLLPDFSKLQPHREGSIESRLVEIKLDDYKYHFGVVYEGVLRAPKTGSYRFYLASDDGSRLLIDGTEVLLNDGIHPASDIKEKGVQLSQGDHKVRLEYFQNQGENQIFLAWKGSDFTITPLSTWKPKRWEQGGAKKKPDTSGMPLVVKNEPVIYRNFIEGAGNRAIAVGYPGGVNIAWSAETMNLALVWRGAFMDAARHWNSRGGGYQPPLGYDVIKPLGELATAEDRRFLGYTLDAARYPTFRYQWGDATVSETYRPDAGKLYRTFNVTGTLPKDATLLLARSEKITPNAATYRITSGPVEWQLTSNNVTLKGDSLNLHLQSGSTTITYQWTK